MGYVCREPPTPPRRDVAVDALGTLNRVLADRYTIEREIGAGGMATVYLARDVRHERYVALKVLSPELGAVLGVERFLAEIRVTANLQHPNLLPLFDSGEADGLLFYVMPYVDGETLRARLSREKQLPIDEAVHICVAVAGALEYAHAHHVIHRDLKPENILLQAGQPMVADFGIALAVSNAGGARITQTGLSLGTPQYMSPEQATGDRTIDGRSDIYSLAAVTYEMLTGDAPYTGSTAQAIIARVLTERPRRVRLSRETVPTFVEQAIDRALAKLPADRFATAREFADAMQRGTVGEHRSAMFADDHATDGTARQPVHRLVVPALWAAAFVLATGIAAAGWIATSRTAQQMPVTFGLSFAPAERMTQISRGNALAVSPDGEVIAFVGGAQQHIYLRPVGDLHARLLPGTDNASDPAFSPDGKSIAFISGDKLKRIPVDGGSVVGLATIPGVTHGLAWSTGNKIVVSVQGRLSAVPASGGPAQPLSPRDTTGGQNDSWPSVLPDGNTVLFTMWRGSASTSRLVVASMKTGARTDLNLPGTKPLGVIDGNLVYVNAADGALMAAPFDTKRLRVTGSPTPLGDSVSIMAAGLAKAALSPTGTLVYQTGTPLQEILVADERGVTQSVGAPAHAYSFPRLSPDGRRIAVTAVTNSASDVWIFNVGSRTLERLTADGAASRPEWAPDGTHVLFRSDQGGRASIAWQPANRNGGATTLLTDSRRNLWEGLLSPDGRTLLYRTGTLGSAMIWTRRMAGDTIPRQLADSQFTEWGARFSPDGRAVAYSSNEGGPRQVYVRPFPTGARFQVSDAGGDTPVWSRDGRLFYINADTLVVVTFAGSPPAAVASRRPLFVGDYFTFSQPGHANFDVGPDGKHFLVLKPVGGDPVTVVIHGWGTVLKARMRDR